MYDISTLFISILLHSWEAELTKFVEFCSEDVLQKAIHQWHQGSLYMLVQFSWEIELF